jgi:hypothetical protein
VKAYKFSSPLERILSMRALKDKLEGPKLRKSNPKMRMPSIKPRMK